MLWKFRSIFFLLQQIYQKKKFFFFVDMFIAENLEKLRKYSHSSLCHPEITSDNLTYFIYVCIHVCRLYMCTFACICICTYNYICTHYKAQLGSCGTYLLVLPLIVSVTSRSVSFVFLLDCVSNDCMTLHHTTLS